MIRRTVVRFALVGLIGTGTLGWSGPRPAGTGKLILVKLVDVSATAFKFEPAAIAVQPGDTLRFEQTTGTPHNVEFTDVPAGTKLGEAKTGPYLITPGQTYDLVIDARFTMGDYKFTCVPHQLMGMGGTLTVKAAGGVVTEKAAAPRKRPGQ